MHYHLEVVMPPKPEDQDLEAYITKVLEQTLAPYDDSNGEAKHSFWDWWVVGGRWSGEKLIQSLDQDQLQKFNDKLNKHKITVSALIAGKESLKPDSQIEEVDKLWQDFFPGKGDVCPLFSHYEERFMDGSGSPVDVCEIKDMPDRLTASRVITTQWDKYGKKWQAFFMKETEVWNGVNFERTEWDSLVKSALRACEDRSRNYSEEWLKGHRLMPDWLAVTVDYHN